MSRICTYRPCFYYFTDEYMLRFHATRATGGSFLRTRFFFNGAIYFYSTITCVYRCLKASSQGRAPIWWFVVGRVVAGVLASFIPLKFYGVPSCLALRVGALSAGARACFSAAPPRGPPGSGGTFFRWASCVQTPDGLPMAREVLAGGGRARSPPPAPLSRGARCV